MKTYLRQHLLILSLALGCVVSCAVDAEHGIVNEWKGVDSTHTLEFYTDGTLISIEDGYHREGKYEFIADDRIRVTVDGFLGIFSSSDVLKVSIDRNRLVIEDFNGNSSEYSKVD